MVDELGTVTPNAPVTILSNNSTVATVSGTTLTAISPAARDCRQYVRHPPAAYGINTPIYSNLFGVTVAGTSPTPPRCMPPAHFRRRPGTSSTLIPIDISKTPPTAGTAINLPGVPNSMVFDRAGVRAFIGTKRRPGRIGRECEDSFAGDAHTYRQGTGCIE